MQDLIKPTGTIKSNRPSSGGAVIKETPMLGIVKNNIDPTRSGRLRVYISELNSSYPDDSDHWITVSYMSPFFGYVQPTANDTGYGTFKNNSSSYGMWNSPPDIGTTVICIFINGSINFGFYIGCVPQPEALTMVPAIGAVDNVVPNKGEAQGLGGAIRLPVTNINTNNVSKASSMNFLDEAKPIHSYVTSIMVQQGIIRDPIRGPITSSAQRESPSRVGWGISTPGRPIYQGGFTDENIVDAAKSGKQPEGLQVISRRGGHSIVMDDGDLIGQSQLVRIRTALGHQILMSDDGQTLMILHSNGQSYIELGKEGTIDLYSTNSVNIRTQGDLNLHADNNINIQATKNLNIQAETINVNSEKDFTQKVGTNNSIYTAGKFTHKVDGAMSMLSSGEASYASSSATYINGSKINLNTGSASLVPAIVPAIPLIAHTDTLYDAIKGYAAAPGKLLSIVSRAPAHAPWANAGQGVDVKTTTSASAALPSSPSAAASATNTAAVGADITNQVTIPVAATVPPTGAVSAALDKGTTASMVGAMAKNAASGATASAVAAGAGIVQSAVGATAVIGTLAQTPKQLETAGILKPGAAPLIDSLVKSGANVSSALTSTLFTGKDGVTDLQGFVQNTSAQVSAQVTNIQQAQTALTNAGVISGKESAGSIAGLVTSGVSAGVASTVDTVKNLAGGIPNLSSGAASNVTSAISSGNFAAGLAQNVTGGLSSIAGAVGSIPKIQGLGGAIDAAKGVAASAFSAVTSSFKPLEAGVPQNLKAIAESNAVSDAASSLTGEASSLTGAVSGAASSLTGAVSGAASSLTGKLSSLSGAASSLTGKLSSLSGTASSLTGKLSSLSGTASSLASGVNALPGGQKTIGAVVDNTSNALSVLPGTTGIKTLIDNSTTAVTNGISLASSFSGAASPLTGAASSLTGGLSSLTGSLDKLKSGASNLTSLALAGLSPAAAATLNASIASLSSGGSVSIKLPTVGTGTMDRSELSTTVGSLLGDPSIPKPNFSGETSTSARAALENTQKEAARNQEALTNEIMDLHTQLLIAKQNYYELEKNLPAGDDELKLARDKWFALVDKEKEKIELLKA